MTLNKQLFTQNHSAEAKASSSTKATKRVSSRLPTGTWGGNGKEMLYTARLKFLLQHKHVLKTWTFSHCVLTKCGSDWLWWHWFPLEGPDWSPCSTLWTLTPCCSCLLFLRLANAGWKLLNDEELLFGYFLIGKQNPKCSGRRLQGTSCEKCIFPSSLACLTNNDREVVKS